MKGEKKAIELTLVKVLAVFCMTVDKGRMLDYNTSQEILDYAEGELSKVGRKDLIYKAKEHYRRNKDKIRVKF